LVSTEKIPVGGACSTTHLTTHSDTRHSLLSRCPAHRGGERLRAHDCLHSGVRECSKVCPPSMLQAPVNNHDSNTKSQGHRSWSIVGSNRGMHTRLLEQVNTRKIWWEVQSIQSLPPLFGFSFYIDARYNEADSGRHRTHDPMPQCTSRAPCAKLKTRAARDTFPARSRPYLWKANLLTRIYKANLLTRNYKATEFTN
jgi:hypothetical protein